MWYGVSSIFARFLNYLLTPYLVGILATASYGEMSLVYAIIPFLNVIFTYGMETTFFRFSNNGEDNKKVFNTISLSILASTIALTTTLLFARDEIAILLRLKDHPEFITWATWIIALDTLSTIPFAKLRNDNRPRKYALIRVVGILINIAFVVFFYSILPSIAAKNPASFLASWYNPNIGAGYVIIANIIQSAITLILLAPQFFAVRWQWDNVLWKQMMLYALPIMIAGFGGMVNETFDRVMLNWLAPVSSATDAKAQVGIYSACYKLSILITLFIQAFKMGAEPFFFQQAKGEDAPKTYARVMNYFVITICVMFLVVMLFIDVWKYFIPNKEMWEGLKVVPILLIANMCLGVYYNLSIWYKLSHSTRPGATITFIGAGVTILVNFLFIPYFGYVACACATMLCYATMMVVSYIWGQRIYPVPYQTMKLLRLFGLMLLVYGAHYLVITYITSTVIHYISGTMFFILYLTMIIFMEKDNLKRLPVVGKFIP